MTIAVVGKNSFLANTLMRHSKTDLWDFLSHNEALDFDYSNISCIINFAIEPSVREGKLSNFDYKLAHKARECGVHYITLSSRAVYGIGRGIELSESNSLLAEKKTYGYGKKLIERDLLANYSDITILRPSNIFGLEYSKQSSRNTFFGILLKTLREEGVIRLDAGPDTIRDFLPVSIFIEYLIQITSKPKPGIYNIGSGVATKVDELAYWVIKGYGSGKIEYKTQVERDSFWLNTTKSIKNFNLPVVTKNQIEEACLQVGKALKEVS